MSYDVKLINHPQTASVFYVNYIVMYRIKTRRRQENMALTISSTGPVSGCRSKVSLVLPSSDEPRSCENL